MPPSPAVPFPKSAQPLGTLIAFPDLAASTARVEACAQDLAERLDYFAEEFAAATETTTHHGGHMTITAAGKQGELAVGADIDHLTRDEPRGGEPDWGKVIMAVNGRDYFTEILKGASTDGAAATPAPKVQ